VAFVTAATIVAMIAAGAGLVWQLRAQTRYRLEQDERKAIAGAALKRASDELVRGHWAETRVALQQAEDRLPEPDGDSLRDQLEQTRRNLELVQRLDAIRMDRATRLQVGRIDTSTSEREYEEAFRAAGLAAPDDDEANVAARVADSPVKDALLAALDDWARVADGAKRARAFGIARRVDPDPARSRLRDPAVWDDENTLAKLARETPADVVTPGLAAAVGARLAKLGEGEALLRAAQSRVPGDFWLNYNLGNALEVSRRPAEAEAYFRAAVALRPGSSLAHVAVGVALEHQGKLKAATEVVRKAVELDPNNTSAYNNLGFYLARQGAFKEAEPHLRRAIELNPTAAWPYSNLGWLLTTQGRLDEANAVLRQALQIDPKHAPSYVSYGWLLDCQGKTDEAANYYRKAIDLNPRNGQAHYQLGWVLDRQDKLGEAEPLYRRALELDPGNIRCINSLGWLLDRQNQLDEAASLYRKGMELDPSYPWPANNLGWLLERRGKLDEAIALYKKAIGASPSMAVAHTNLARSLLESGRFSEAQKAADGAMKLYPLDQPDHLEAEGYRRRAAACERLPASEKGSRRPAGAAEVLARADQARARRRYAEAAYLAAEAFAADAKLAADLRAGHRYRAASAAALAGCGQGEDPPGASDTERQIWRQPALTWLQAELADCTPHLRGDASEIKEASERLKRWLSDADLAGVREPANLSLLPPEERMGWEKFWDKVRSALPKEAASK
jgi:tetratricopeptide (TPR) repeat protein